MAKPLCALLKAVPHRWVICALLFFATTINYIDRQLLGVLAPTLQREIGWSEIEYSSVVTSFQAAYAIGLLGFGWLIDRLGSRIGLILAVSVWSIASLFHGFASSVTHFILARFGLGLAEAGNFPASIKSVSEWFPARERAFAIGVFNSGSNVGAILTPLLVPAIVLTWGWQAAFILSGGVGLIWVVAAVVLFSPPEGIQCATAQDRALLSQEGEARHSSLSWRDVARHRATWGFALAKFLTDPVWWFYLYWAPKYLTKQFGVELVGLAAPLVVMYLMADVGSIGGGWASARLVRSGIDARSARLRVMLVCAVLALFVIFAADASSLWSAALLLGLAAGAHQGWSANLFGAASELFPKEGVASVVGIGGMAGAIGGMGIALFTGFILEKTGSYLVPFIVCSSAYLVAWVVFRYMVGNDERGSMVVSGSGRT